MKKHRSALVAAFIITLVIGLGMFYVGGSAAANQNGVPVKDSPTSSIQTDAQSAGQQQVAQLQSLVSQYQQREQQYQNELNNVQGQLDQADAQLAQYQQLIQFLQMRGVIGIDGQGRVILGERQGFSDRDN